MAYEIHIVTPDGPVVVTAPVNKFKIDSEYDETEVCVSWDRTDLADDPTARTALMNAWPGRDTLTVGASGQLPPSFEGKLTSVSWCEDYLNVEAVYTAPSEPHPLYVRAEYDETSPEHNRVQVTVDNFGQGSVSVDFGDGSEEVTNPGDGITVSDHAYDMGGNFVVVATDTDMPERTGQAVVHVPGPSADLELTAEADGEDPDKLRVKVSVDNHSEGAVSVDFGDGTPTVVNPGDGTTWSMHDYGMAGEYNVTATDTDRPIRTATKMVTVTGVEGAESLIVTVVADPSDETRKTARLTADNKGNGAVTVTWGDGSTSESNPGDGTTVSSHSYVNDGTFSVVATDEDDPSRMVDTLITLPFTQTGS